MNWNKQLNDLAVQIIRICTIQDAPRVRLAHFEQEVLNEKEKHSFVHYIYHHYICHYSGVSVYQRNYQTYINPNDDTHYNTYYLYCNYNNHNSNTIKRIQSDYLFQLYNAGIIWRYQ